LLNWLRDALDDYRFDVLAAYRREGDHAWPLSAENADDLARQLAEGGHFLSLPKEPAALANVLEVSLVDFILERVASIADIQAVRGTERGYPDLEFTGSRFGGGYHAVDVKVARRANSKRQTQSRITLYTGNTYFRYPALRWPGTFRPFDEYDSHLDVLAIYTLDPTNPARVTELELIVEEPWKIASRQRSSTTREYIGAVQSIEKLRAGAGEFEAEADFYAFWRKFKFKIGPAVQQQLDKLLARGRDGS
jgi:hypothetical protein